MTAPPSRRGGSLRAVRRIWELHPRDPGPTHAPRHELSRRGVDLGWIAAGGRAEEVDAARAWDGAEAVHLAGALRPAMAEHRVGIRRARNLFSRVRVGATLADFVTRRLHARGAITPTGTSVDLGDEREIEKVHAIERRRGNVHDDLYAKLSWISHDEHDHSLRIRFSFGSERLDEWHTDPERAEAADRLAEGVFPECALLAKHRGILDFLRRRVGSPVRLSERIVFSNAPGGGARFHHDAEVGQLGVVYAQLAGRTAWLAVPKRRLADDLRALASPALARTLSTECAALRALDAGDSKPLERLLNRTPALVERIATRGDCHVLDPGDALLLPSHSPDDATWHSVFALGTTASLAHSFGIFRRG